MGFQFVIRYSLFTIHYSLSPAHIKISQRVIQTGLEVCAWFSLTDDERAAYAKFTGGKFLIIGSGDHHAPGGDSSFHFFGFGTSHINDLSGLG